jgi:hypothetical protein
MSRQLRPIRPPVSYCGKKVRYDKKGAVSAKNLRYEQSHVKLRIYEHAECGGWHLTSKLFWHQ